jgi:hypothetical protein
MIRRKLLFAGFCSALLLSPVWLAAQQHQESVAEAARRARAEKKSAPKPAMVITNDNLDTIKGAVSVVGQTPAPAAPAAAPNEKGGKATKGAEAKGAPGQQTKPPAKDEAYWKQKFSDARKTLAEDEKELNILQREFNLKQQQYYSDPNVAMHQQHSSQDLIDNRKKINEKAADVAKDKQNISDLEDELRKSGGDPGWAR